MKTHVIAFSTLLLLAAASVAPAQDDPAVLARMAARRAAENGGGDAAAAAAPDTAADTNAAVAADAGATNALGAADAGTNAAADPGEAARLARLAAAAKETAAATKLPGNLASLQIITQRNIFDPNRLPWISNRPPQVVVPVRVETFTFRGTSEETGKGIIHAMFEGDGIPIFPATRDVGNMVNGFKIKAITRTNVTLVDTNSTTNAEFVLDIDKGFTRNDGGPWKPAYYTLTYETAAPRQQRADTTMAAPQYMAAQPMMAAPTFSFTTDPSMDPTMAYGGNTRNRPNNRNGGNNRRGGGGGGFGGGNTAFAPAAPAPDPNAPIDPAVLERLRARRATGD